MIEFINVTKAFPNVTPIKDMSFKVNKGDVVSVIGPSGTGKSTLLRMINMLERPTSGRILVDGEDITVSGYSSAKLRQKVGMVFQSFNLFENMTVIENVCFGQIHIKKTDRSEAFRKGMDILRKVGLAAFAFQYPESLSGGQKQRAAIARAIANDSEIILFDEPTSALDPVMVTEVKTVIRTLADQGYTMMIVTHDMKFARDVSSRVFFVCDGIVYDDGKPDEIFDAPKKEKTADFIRVHRDFYYSTKWTDFDFPEVMSVLTAYCRESDFSRSLTNKVLGITEEIYLASRIWDKRRPFDGQTDITLTYFKDREIVSLEFSVDRPTGWDYDNTPETELSLSIISSYASRYTFDETCLTFEIAAV